MYAFYMHHPLISEGEENRILVVTINAIGQFSLVSAVCVRLLPASGCLLQVVVPQIFDVAQVFQNGNNLESILWRKHTLYVDTCKMHP
jgi:hypothetical protein